MFFFSCYASTIPGMGTPQFVYPSANRWTIVVDVWLFPVFDDEEWSIRIQLLAWTNVVVGEIPKSGITGPYGKHIFNLIRNGQTVFKSGWTIWHSQSIPKCLTLMVASFASKGTQAKNTEVLLLLTRSQNVQKQNSQALKIWISFHYVYWAGTGRWLVRDAVRARPSDLPDLSLLWNLWYYEY